MNKILCFDIGGTSIKSGVFLTDGTMLEQFSDIPTNAEAVPIIETITQAIEVVLPKYDLSGIAISSAGVIDSENGKVIYSGYTIPNYIGTDFKQVIAQRFSLPCEVENDVNAACLGELWQGAGKNSQSVVCLTVGTGVGGAIVVNGELVNGVGYTAGELGYMLINNHYFQDIASTTFLVKRANQLANETNYQSGRDVFSAAKNGDNHCIEAIDELLDNLTTGLVNIIYLLNPEKIILGGGIMSQKEYLSDKIKEKIDAKLISQMFNKTQIEFAQNKNNAGMLGALYHFNQKHK